MSKLELHTSISVSYAIITVSSSPAVMHCPATVSSGGSACAPRDTSSGVPSHCTAARRQERQQLRRLPAQGPACEIMGGCSRERGGAGGNLEQCADTAHRGDANRLRRVAHPPDEDPDERLEVLPELVADGVC